MLNPQLTGNGFGSTIGAVVIPVLSTLSAQHFSTRTSEPYSEIFCWAILPLLFRVSKRSNVGKGSPFNICAGSTSQPTSLWIVAICAAIACICKVESHSVVLLPALTPLLFVAEKALRPKLQESMNGDITLISCLVTTLSGTILVASIAIFALSDGNNFETALSAIATVALFFVFVTFIPRSFSSRRCLPLVNFEEDIYPLASRVLVTMVVAIGIQSLAFGLVSLDLFSIIAVGMTKALSWYSLSRFASHTSWLAASTVLSFCVLSDRNPFVQSSELHAFATFLASVLVLSQIAQMLPAEIRKRSTLWILILIPLLPYLMNIIEIEKAVYLSPYRTGSYSKHPVELLVDQSKTEFEILVQRQSKSFVTACTEYRRRYGVEPPPGFDQWYQFAVQSGSPIIDDFDAIYESISPFWKKSGIDILKAVKDVQRVWNIEVWGCSFSGTRATTDCTHPNRSYDRHFGMLFNQLMEGLQGRLPDVKFLVNHFDEPRVLFAHNGKQSQSSEGEQPRVMDFSGRPSWDEITKFCASHQNVSKHIASGEIDMLGLEFVTNRTSVMNLCQHPEYSKLHGLFLSPPSLRFVEGMVPILTTGSPSTMNDILFPSPAYIESEFRYDEENDIEWKNKQNKLYWAGSATGGVARDDSWHYFHRQRFVSLAQNLERKQHYYLRKINGVVRPYASSFLNIRLYDVAFSRIFGCGRKYCREQNAFFRTKSWSDKDRALKSKLVFDIDGNGISGRYYKLLASKSVPLKQTVFREWHDDRLMPWVHYVPVSQSMEELPELVFYLTSTPNGRRVAKQIADQGRVWFGKAFRDVDMSIYLYRLLLELARIQDPKREAS